MDLSKLSDADLVALQSGNLSKVSDQGLALMAQPSQEPSMMRNLGAGVVRGAGAIGSTLLAPVDYATDVVMGKQGKMSRHEQRVADLDRASTELFGANPASLSFQAGKLGYELPATMGVGGGLARVAEAVPALAKAAPALIDALRTSGFSAGKATGLTGLAARGTGGAITGGVSAGLVNPEDAGMGAGIGGTLPMAGKVIGATGQALGRAVRGGEIAPEVADLARRAKELGIDIPADRLTDSKFLNALASGLNYVPFSGRAHTEQTMVDQLNTAASRLIGQDTKNMAKALRSAKTDLGGKFDSFLKENTIIVDPALKADTVNILKTAEKELSLDALKPIQSQVTEILTKGASGEIDGQTAYNIKRALDRMGKGNTPEAFHARELRDKLMDALERSVTPEEAQAFAQVRKQYGNMLALRKIAQNGAEGEISVGRLANMKNINNSDLQELADISAQFVRPREGQHGAMQRGFAALGIGGMTGPAGLAATAGAGRVANTALNSQMAKDFLMQNQQNPALANALRRAMPLTYQAGSVMGAQ